MKIFRFLLTMARGLAMKLKALMRGDSENKSLEAHRLGAIPFSLRWRRRVRAGGHTYVAKLNFNRSSTAATARLLVGLGIVRTLYASNEVYVCKTIRRLALLEIVLSGLLLGVTTSALAQSVPPTGGCTDDLMTNTTTCRIDAPIVTQFMTEYDGAPHPDIFLAHSNDCDHKLFGVTLPSILLRRGDTVTVDADGCVQRGGKGKTWRRYVTPRGDAEDRLYHGLLGVRNAIEPDGTTMPNPVRIKDVRLQPFWIVGDQFLSLGYEDGNYCDNGYWGHDPGNPAQCDGLHGFGGNAFVTVTIQHNTPPPPSKPPLCWDIVAADPQQFTDPFDQSNPLDMNALLLNPRWGWQTAEPTTLMSCPHPAKVPQDFEDCGWRESKLCTSQAVTTDTPDFSLKKIARDFASLGDCKQGHVNWTVVSYHGPIFWHEHDSGIFADDDYNFKLLTPPTNGLPSGVTAHNAQEIKLEFKAGETINHWDKIPFWHDFHHAVDHNDTKARDMVRGKEAVVVGLLGLDLTHGGPSEIHPVFVLAIHIKSEPFDDTWAIFARNYGNEGMCSDEMHYANFNTVTLRLPRLPITLVPATAEATLGADTKWVTNTRTVTDPDFSSGPKQDTLIRFHLPSPPAHGGDGARVAGELHLQWSHAIGNASSLIAANAAPLPVQIDEGETGEPEALIAELWAQLTPQQQATYLAKLPPRPAASPDTAELATNVVGTPPAPASDPPVLTAARDRRQQQDREDQWMSFCVALNGQLPSDIGVSCATLFAGAGDKTPPVITSSATPATLWPPNGEMVPVTVSGIMTDNEPGWTGVNPRTANYAVTDEYGSVEPSGDITVGPNGRYSFTIQLQAFRHDEDRDGREYTITVSAQDNAGNTGSAGSRVTVPHDQPPPLQDRTKKLSIIRSDILQTGSSDEIGEFVQHLTVQNISGSDIEGPVYLILIGLDPATQALVNKAGLTANVPPPGLPFVVLNIGEDNVLGAGDFAETVFFKFTSPLEEGITYTIQAMAGKGLPP